MRNIQLAVKLVLGFILLNLLMIWESKQPILIFNGLIHGHSR